MRNRSERLTNLTIGVGIASAITARCNHLVVEIYETYRFLFARSFTFAGKSTRRANEIIHANGRPNAWQSQ
jgi:hypothetical protein